MKCCNAGKVYFIVLYIRECRVWSRLKWAHTNEHEIRIQKTYYYQLMNSIGKTIGTEIQSTNAGTYICVEEKMEKAFYDLKLVLLVADGY